MYLFPSSHDETFSQIQTSPDKVDFAEVQFYFHGVIDETRQALALVCLFSEPDPILLEASYQTVYSVQKLASGLRVIDAKSIITVIAVIPHDYKVNGDPEQRYFIWEKMGMDMASLTNVFADDEDLDMEEVD